MTYLALLVIPFLAGGPSGQTQLRIVGAVFEVPPGCRAECSFVADGYSGSVSCPGRSGPVSYGARMEPRNEEPVRVWLDAKGSDRLGDAELHWGVSKRRSSRFCATIAYPVAGPGSLRFRHLFCVPATATDLKALAVSILRSFRRVPNDSFELDTCGLFIE